MRPISRSHRELADTDREMRCTLCRAEWCRHFVETSSRQAPELAQNSQMITIATATAALSPPLNLRHHATSLRDRGYTVIPDAGISADLVKDARFAVASEFSRLLDNLEELGIAPVDSSYAFKELDKRHANRWSVRPTQAEAAWSGLVDSAVVAARISERTKAKH